MGKTPRMCSLLISALMPHDGNDGIFRTNMVPLDVPIENTSIEFQNSRTGDLQFVLPLHVSTFKSFEPCAQSQYYCWTHMFSYVCLIDLNFRVDKPSISIVFIPSIDEPLA